jgi:ABC-2 type transport system ATP-binding protein
VDRGRVAVEGTPEALKNDLRGDVVHVELDDPVSAASAFELLRRLGDLRDVVVDRSTVRARSDEGARVVAHVLSVLDRAGVPVQSATLARPSLDDVYLRHAGRSFDKAA